jgi:hypothetical protein
VSAWTPFRILKMAKSCRHLLKPTPFRAVVIFIAAVLVDILQIILDIAYQAGVALNRFIDIAFGVMLATYFWLSGASFVKNWSNLVALIISIIMEEIPDVDALPFWSLDVIYSIGKSWLPIIAAEQARLESEAAEQRQEIMATEQKKAAFAADYGLNHAPRVVQGNFTPKQAAGKKAA